MSNNIVNAIFNTDENSLVEISNNGHVLNIQSNFTENKTNEYNIPENNIYENNPYENEKYENNNKKETNKKRTNKKRTNKKRTNEKRTNEKETNKEETNEKEINKEIINDFKLILNDEFSIINYFLKTYDNTIVSNLYDKEFTFMYCEFIDNCGNITINNSYENILEYYIKNQI